MNSIFALKIANVLQEVKREAADIHRVHFGVQISYMPQSLCNFSGEPCQLYSNISNCCWPWCWWCDLVEGNSRIRTELGEDKSACSFKYMYLMREIHYPSWNQLLQHWIQFSPRFWSPFSSSLFSFLFSAFRPIGRQKISLGYMGCKFAITNIYYLSINYH